MEFEIADEPQGIGEDDENTADGGIVEEHRALKNQSSVKPEDYPKADRKGADLTGTQQK